MVYYFTSNVVSPPALIYVGKDKFENEELIKFGFEEDVWVSETSSVVLKGSKPTFSQFHVDNLSSAHIYIRLKEGESWEEIPKVLVEDCAQLTKANSIEGNKKDNITVIYTPWSNLKKDGGMAIGQVGFKDPRKVKRVHVAQRENPIVNRLNKTKTESFPDLRLERENRDKERRLKDRAAQNARQKEEARVARERKEKAWQKDHAYDELHTAEAVAGSSNQDRDEDFLDDFM